MGLRISLQSQTLNFDLIKIICTIRERNQKKEKKENIYFYFIVFLKIAPGFNESQKKKKRRVLLKN